jgi:hypothetical protein
MTADLQPVLPRNPCSFQRSYPASTLIPEIGGEFILSRPRNFVCRYVGACVMEVSTMPIMSSRQIV